MHSRGNVDDILWRAIKSKHMKYFSSMPNDYDRNLKRYALSKKGQQKPQKNRTEIKNDQIYMARVFMLIVRLNST